MPNAGRKIELPSNEERFCDLVWVMVIIILVLSLLTVGSAPSDDFLQERVLPVAPWFLGGAILGTFLALCQRHPRRRLGLVPWGLSGAALGLVCAALSAELGCVQALLLAAGSGLAIPPLALAAQGASSPVRRLILTYLVVLLTPTLILCLGPIEHSPALAFGMCAAALATAALVTLWYFRRETFEQLLEIPFFFMYRFRTAGPGVDCFPLRGPVLVVANHSAWMDPLWLGKVLPRRLIPMMTSVFFDLPGMRLLMVYFFHAIRVQDSRYRRDVPEIQKAIDALDRGECVVIFPEGAMRRTEERPLKLFGQGVWHILSERPETPVVVCWIEGGFGSFFSYWNGPPTKKKRFDWFRYIQVVIAEPQFIQAEVLADQRRTRRYMMEQCVLQRQHLGLDVYPLPRVEEEEEEVSDERETKA